MDGERPLPPFPSADDEALLRDAEVWPPDAAGNVRDPASGLRWRWWRVVELLRRDRPRCPQCRTAWTGDARTSHRMDCGIGRARSAAACLADLPAGDPYTWRVERYVAAIDDAGAHGARSHEAAAAADGT